MKSKAMLKNYFKAITNVASQGDAQSEPSLCRKRLMPYIQKPRVRSSKSNKDKCPESVTLKPAEASLRQGWKEALAGETKPVSELWEGIDAE